MSKLRRHVLVILCSFLALTATAQTVPALAGERRIAGGKTGEVHYFSNDLRPPSNVAQFPQGIDAITIKMPPAVKPQLDVLNAQTEAIKYLSKRLDDLETKIKLIEKAHADKGKS